MSGLVAVTVKLYCGCWRWAGVGSQKKTARLTNGVKTEPSGSPAMDHSMRVAASSRTSMIFSMDFCPSSITQVLLPTNSGPALEPPRTVMTMRSLSSALPSETKKSTWWSPTSAASGDQEKRACVGANCFRVARSGIRSARNCKVGVSGSLAATMNSRVSPTATSLSPMASSSGGCPPQATSIEVARLTSSRCRITFEPSRGRR